MAKLNFKEEKQMKRLIFLTFFLFIKITFSHEIHIVCSMTELEAANVYFNSVNELYKDRLVPLDSLLIAQSTLEDVRFCAKKTEKAIYCVQKRKIHRKLLNMIKNQYSVAPMTSSDTSKVFEDIIRTRKICKGRVKN